MRFELGDIVFTRDGRPNVVTGRKDSGHIQVEKKGKTFEEKRNFGFTNGLTPKNREEFEKIVKEARQHEAPEKRVSELQEKVMELRQDPKNWVLKRYLEGEMSFIMNSEGVHPNTFEIDERNIF